MPGRFSPGRRSFGKKSWPWMSRPSADLKTTCSGVMSLSAGKLTGQVSEARGCAVARGSASRFTNGCAVRRASDPTYAKKSLPGIGVGRHSMPEPLVNCCKESPEAATLHKWRRSMSLQFELNKIVFSSDENDHCSTSQLPGVKSFCAPPAMERL